MVLSWSTLLCADTLAEKEATPSSWVDYPMDPFEQDYREIVSSASFRHLQDKAQVYQLGKGDFVRTRLTHSLEVSTVAKQLGIMMIYNKKWNHIPAFSNMPVEYARTIPTVLACAGLLHDMGNPPFGHEGEKAIGSWYANHFRADDFTFFGRLIREVLSEQMKTDLCNFEGNAQVIRMLSKCRFPSEEQEANVSYATISTLIKYPVSSVEMRKDAEDMRLHKFGYYLSEQELVREIRRKTGMELEQEPYARNPLTYLLEAADDIAYVASDLEDALSQGTITIPQLIAFMEQEIDALPEDGDEMHQMQMLTVKGILNNLTMRLEKSDKTDDRAQIEVFQKWTNYLRNWLMYVTAGSFVANWESIMDGTFRGDLLKGSQHKYTVKILKSEMYTNVYPRLAQMHLTSFNILTDLMNRFGDAVIYWDTDAEPDYLRQAYIDMLPRRLKNAYLCEKGTDEAYNLYLRFRMVTDFIASMSDGYAMSLYRKLNAFSY